MPFLKTHFLPLAVGVAGMIFFVYGLTALSAPKKDSPDILFESASDTSKKDVAGASTSEKQIAVDVEGAVLKPGVYKLKEESRVQDALIAAGGYASDADREKAAKTLNLASKLTDGAKMYVPAVGESDSAVVVGSGASDAQAGTTNINTATEEELDALSGVGQVTAGKIIDNRPYSRIEELVEKKVVGKSVFEKIKNKIGI